MIASLTFMSGRDFCIGIMKIIPTDRKPIIIAGLLSAGLFFTVLALGLGSFFLFIPSLPLFYVGLSMDTRVVFSATLLAAVVIAVVGHVGIALVFLLIIGFPAAYLSHSSLLVQRSGGAEVWFPIGRALFNLIIAAAGFLAALTLILALGEHSLPELLATYIKAVLEPLKEQFGPEITLLAEDWAFLPVAVTLWVWGTGLYAHAWLSGRLLAGKRRNIRPDMAITPFDIPGWMLSLLGICALASLIGGPSSEFLGKTLLIFFALPYFFLGLSLIHRASEKWPNRTFFLFIIYLLLIMQLWPVLLVSAYGLWHQIKSLNKGLPAR